MNYKSVIATKIGGPEVLQVVDNTLRPPAPGEARIRVLAAAVCRPDVTVRTGAAFYSGTPLAHKPPFVPGYAVVGVVEALGAGAQGLSIGDRVGALTVIGGYTEVLYWKSNLLVSVPTTLDPAEAVTLILNYLVAYQTMHRSARVIRGDTVLLIGASGGIGTALLQLGRLAGLRMYAIASRGKHAILAQYGAHPIDYHSQDYVAILRQAEPGGLDAVISGLTSIDTIRRGLSLLRRGGRMVCYGEPDGLPAMLPILGTLIATNLLPNGKTLQLYGTSMYTFRSRAPLIEDWSALFKLLEEGKIKPVIEQKFPILEAARANALLESGRVTGNLVLVTPELC